MATISIEEATRKKLLSIAADLQKETGERVDFDQVISHLTESYQSNQKRPELLEEFAKGFPKGNFDHAYKIMIQERERDEKSLQHKLKH